MSPTLDLIGLVVDDMGTSLAFYRELGLEIFPLTPGHGPRDRPGSTV
jgi:hypothetical protein